jgi:hypothetical protein
MKNKLLSVPESRDLIQYTRSVFEKVNTWDWEGIKFKSKLDISSDLFICDLKSTRDASPASFKRTIFDERYYRQIGMYADGDAIINDTMILKDCYIIAIESAPPYGVSVHKITTDYLQQGIVEYRNLAQQLTQCRKDKYWPTYTYKAKDGIEIVDVPKWLKE